MKEGTTVDNTSFGECKILKGGLIKDLSQENTAGLVRFTISYSRSRNVNQVSPYYLLSHLAISTKPLSVLYF
jgi:hypothetical protein